MEKKRGEKRRKKKEEKKRKKRKGGESTKGETLAKELNLERSDFVFDRQPNALRSGRAHQWLNGDLTGGNFSALNR